MHSVFARQLVAASGGSGAATGGTIFFLLWFATAAISVFLFTRMPKVRTGDPRVGIYRMFTLVAGFIPCVGFNLILVLVYYAIWRGKVSGHLPRDLDGDYDDTFDTAPAPQRRSSPGAERDNPFL